MFQLLCMHVVFQVFPVKFSVWNCC